MFALGLPGLALFPRLLLWYKNALAQLFGAGGVNNSEAGVVPDPDAQLMLQFQNGDAAAFETLFRKYTRPLINFAYRFVGSRAKAEELAQDVLFKVYQARGSYRPEAKFGTWVFRIATNACLNELRHWDYRQPPVSLNTPVVDDGPVPDPADDHTPAPDHEAEAMRLERALQAALAQLPERQRAALLLHRFQGLSYRDIAVALETSESSVRSLIHRATVGLREVLKPFLDVLPETEEDTS